MPNVIPGHTYRIEISTTFRTAFISVALQKTIVNFDNIRLRVEDGTDTFGEPGAITDPADQISDTSARLNGRVNARALPTTFVYEYGTNATGALPNTLPATGPPYDGGSQRTFVSRPRTLTGLTAVHALLLRDRGHELRGHDQRRAAAARHGLQAGRHDARRA